MSYKFSLLEDLMKPYSRFQSMDMNKKIFRRKMMPPEPAVNVHFQPVDT